MPSKIIPLTLFATQSYFGSKLDQSGADKFKAATEAQSNLLNDLREHPINGEGGKAYWSNNVTSLKEPGANVIDRKIFFDGAGITVVGGAHYALSMLNAPIAALPLVPYLVATPVMGYSELVREQDFKTVVDQYWNPSCDTSNLQAKLKAADNVGNNYNPEEYAKFISGAYIAETASVFTEGLTVVAGLLSKTPVKPAVTSDSDPDGFGKGGPAAPAPVEGTLESALPEVVKDSAAAAPAATTPGVVGRAFEYMGNTAAAQYFVAASVNAAVYTGYVAGRASAFAEAAVQAATNTGITGRDLAVAASAVVGTGVAIKTYDNLSPIADGVNSAAHALFDGAYTALGALAGARDIEVVPFVTVREQVRLEVMGGFLKAQFSKCGEDAASIAVTYTQGCGTSTNEIIDNLLAGADGCSYVA